MKVTQKQVVEFLKKVGVQDVEIVESDADSDFSESDALSSVDASRKPILEPQITQQIKDASNTAAMGMLYGKLDSAIAKKYGVPRAEIEKIDGIDNKIEFAQSAYSAKLDGDKQSQEQHMKSLMDTHKQEIERTNADWTTKYQQALDKYTDREMFDAMLGSMKDVPTKWDKSAAAKDILKHARETYDVKYDDAEKKLKYYIKGTENPAYNEAGNAFITDSDIAKAYLQPRHGWETDMRNHIPDGGNGTPAIPPAAKIKGGDHMSNLQALNAQIDAATSATGS